MHWIWTTHGYLNLANATIAMPINNEDNKNTLRLFTTDGKSWDERNTDRAVDILAALGMLAAAAGVWLVGRCGSSGVCGGQRGVRGFAGFAGVGSRAGRQVRAVRAPPGGSRRHGVRPGG